MAVHIRRHRMRPVGVFLGLETATFRQHAKTRRGIMSTGISESPDRRYWRQVYRAALFSKQLPKFGSALVCFLLAIKSAINVGVSFMVCEELDQLEWDFIQARAGSLDIDSLGWTDREFSCLEAILDHKREGHQGEH